MKTSTDTWFGRWLKNRRGLTPVERFVVLAFSVLLILLLLPACQGLLYRAQARAALANAKAVRLAAQVVSAECRGEQVPFSDRSGPYGFAPGLEQKILLLSRVPGELYLLEAGEDGYSIAAAVYREYEYTVWYSAAQGNWEVTRGQTLISASLPI